MDIIEYVKKNNIKPRKIEMNVALSSTGLDDPEIAELAYDIVTYYKDTDIPSGIDGVLTPKTPDNAGMVANSFLKYEKLCPTKPMEFGAKKVTGISDSDLADGIKGIENTLLYRILTKAQNYPDTKFEIVFANNYALDLFNKSISNDDPRYSRALYSYDDSSLKFTPRDGVKIMVLEDLAMRYLANEIPTFSLANIRVATDGRYTPENFLNDLYKFSNQKPTKNVKNLSEQLDNIKNIVNYFKESFPDCAKNDFFRENKPLEVIPLRHIGLKNYLDRAGMTDEKFYGVLQKAKEGNGCAVLSTIRYFIVDRYRGNDFKEKCLNMFERFDNMGFYDPNTASDLVYGLVKGSGFKATNYQPMSENPTLDEQVAKIKTNSSPLVLPDDIVVPF